MSTHATGTLEITNWNETPYEEMGGGAKLTRAHVTTSFHGDIEGEGMLEYLMAYPDDNSAAAVVSYVGLQRVVGRVGDRSGSFVLQHSGTYEESTPRDTWFVVPGSGTGDLRGLRGEGGYVAQHDQPITFTFDYDFA